MGRKSRFSTDEKLEFVLRYIEGKDSINNIAKQIGVNGSSLETWIRNYQSLGINGLNTTSKNTSYPEELKTMAVRDYLSGEGSLRNICKKYGIKSHQQLLDWIMKYNSHEKLKSSGTGGTKIMTNVRKTTYEERVDIVKYCIEHQNNYTETSEHFQVSYQQVYSWVSKYEKGGVLALQDKRGRRKSIEEMSELEKLKAENKLLQAENKRKQMELDFLKKLKEIERGRY